MAARLSCSGVPDFDGLITLDQHSRSASSLGERQLAIAGPSGQRAPFTDRIAAAWTWDASSRGYPGQRHPTRRRRTSGNWRGRTNHLSGQPARAVSRQRRTRPCRRRWRGRERPCVGRWHSAGAGGAPPDDAGKYRLMAGRRQMDQVAVQVVEVEDFQAKRPWQQRWRR